MSNSPITDALARLETVRTGEHDWDFKECVSADLCRGMESDRAALVEALRSVAATYRGESAHAFQKALQAARALLTRIDGDSHD